MFEAKELPKLNRFGFASVVDCVPGVEVGVPKTGC